MSRETKVATPDPGRPDVAAARQHTGLAIDTMAAILRDTESGAANRLRAARELLERGWGKAMAGSETSDDPSYDEIIASLGPRNPATPAAL